MMTFLDINEMKNLKILLENDLVPPVDDNASNLNPCHNHNYQKQFKVPYVTT